MMSSLTIQWLARQLAFTTSLVSSRARSGLLCPADWSQRHAGIPGLERKFGKQIVESVTFVARKIGMR